MHKQVIDGVALANAFATLITILPSIAALLSIIWYGMRIYDYWKNKQIKD